MGMGKWGEGNLIVLGRNCTERGLELDLYNLQGVAYKSAVNAVF